MSSNKKMIQNDRRRTNSTVDKILVVNESITTPVLNVADLTVSRNLTLATGVVLNGASDITTNTFTTNVINTTDLDAITINSTTINAGGVNTTDLIASGNITGSRLILMANTTQITLGSSTKTILDIDSSANRTISIPSTGGLNANIILSEGAQTINGVKTFTDMVVFLSSFSIASLALTAVSNQLVMGTGQTVTVNAPTPAASRTYTMPDVLANASFVMTEGAQTLNGVKTFSATAVFLAGFSLASLTLSAVTNQLTLGSINTITVNAPTPAASRTYTMPDVLANASFVMTEGAQTLNGVKTFSATAVFLAGFSLASLTLSAVTNQLTLGAGNTITVNAPTPAVSRVYTMPDVLANASFVMTEGSQSVNGTKMFFNNITFDANLILNNTSVIQFSKPTNQMTFTTGGFTTTLNVGAAAGSRTYTVTDVLANASFVMTEGTQTINGAKTFSGLVTMNGGFSGSSASIALTNTTNQIVFGSGTTTTLNVPTPGANRIYTIDDIGTNASFVMNAGAQNIGGSKNFLDGGSFPALTLTDGSNQLILNNVTIDCQPSGHTYTIQDAGGAASFVMTAGVQTLNGAKTFGSAITVTPTTNQLVLGITNTTTINSVAPAASRVYTIPDAGGAASFVLNTGTATPANLYEVQTTTISFNAPWLAVLPSVNIYLIRIGRIVTMELAGFSIAPTVSPSNGTITSSSNIGSSFRPVESIELRMTAIMNTSEILGLCRVATTGAIEISRTVVNGSSDVVANNYVNPVSATGFKTFSVSWVTA